MKRLVLAPLLITLSFLNMGFMHNKKEIKGIVCGDEKFFKDLKENFLQKNIYKESKEIDFYYGWIWYFDLKTGQIYKYEKYNDSIIKAKENYNKSADGEIIYKYKGTRKKNNILFEFSAFKNQVEIKDKKYRYTEIFNLNDMSYKYEVDGKKYEDKCEYFPIPKEVNIQS